MQSYKSLVYFGLTFLLLNLNLFSSVIWESDNTPRSISFSKFNSMTISVTLPEGQKLIFLDQLKKLIGDKAKIIIIDHLKKDINKILSSPLTLHFAFSTTDNPAINLLRTYSTSQGKIVTNSELFNAVLWEKIILFENQDHIAADIKLALAQTSQLFFSQYFSTQAETATKPIFYFVFN